MNTPIEPACSEATFLAGVNGHVLTVLRNDGANRHLRFRKPGSNTHWFDLITWPGRLCVDGDCGTYVFSRLQDMFTFFRMGDYELKSNREKGRSLFINPGYWQEKCLSSDRNGAIEEWSEDLFRQTVLERLESHLESYGDDLTESEIADLREEVELQVLSANNEYDANESVRMFTHRGFKLNDFWEARVKEYTFSFLWNCYAIVWGIEQFDKLTPPAVTPAPDTERGLIAL